MNTINTNTAEKLEPYTDEELVEAIQAGDNSSFEALMNKYKKIVEKNANSYFLVGGSKDDIIQEGMIGLFKATRDYNKDMDASFYYFAQICIKRQMITAVKASTRLKHQPLNSYISLNKPVFDEEKEDTVLEDIVANNKEILDPELIFIGEENVKSIKRRLKDKLSKMELDIYDLFIDGMSYTEIAERLDKSPKSIDNALQRIKKKLVDILEDKG